MLSRPHRPQGYVGRFAPSPSGPLHDGSLVSAMASYLDARAHGGRWLVRIEDIDTPRVANHADTIILGQLQDLGMRWDAPPVWQSQRHALYQATFEQLQRRGLVYGCACTRQQLRNRAYPGTCRHGIPPGQHIRAWRFRVPPGVVHFDDRWLGPQQQDVEASVGDFIIKRADGLWAYQFVVVVDDGDQGVTDIVRGADLLSSTARQLILTRRLGLTYPRVMHVPLVLDAYGHKLSKQNHALALDCSEPLKALAKAWKYLGFEALPPISSLTHFWQHAIAAWAGRFNI